MKQSAQAWMRQKSDQLAQAHWNPKPALVALDFRALVAGLPRGEAASMPFYERHNKQCAEQRGALIAGLQAFLQKDSSIAGVLAWWRRFHFETTAWQWLWRPWEIELITKDDVLSMQDPQGLNVAVRQLVGVDPRA